MRKYGKIDANQNKVVKQLRQLGISVAITSSLGNGFVDLVLGWKKRNYLIELKDENKYESEKKLTKDEQKFFDSWRGQVSKCENLSEILKVIKF